MKLILVAGARPNFMKIAPIARELRRHPDIVPVLVHTGQHYDERMSNLFFRQLGLPEPDINLGVGSATQAVQMATIMIRFEPIVLEQKPDAVLVVGDVNSTIACGLVAVKLGVTPVHVEAGLRSGDRSMPEEIKRILTDAISNLLFCTEQAGVDNLTREGVESSRIHLVGNVMIDTLLQHRTQIAASTILKDLGLRQEGFAVVTLHRPSNVDDPSVLGELLDVLDVVQTDQPVIFPVHPRTRDRLDSFELRAHLERMPGLHFTEHLGYLDFQRLVSTARVVPTDSGGIQEETTALGVPCLTLRDTTERPARSVRARIAWLGCRTKPSSQLTGRSWGEPPRTSSDPPLWDGHAAERIIGILKKRFGHGAASAVAV